MTKRVYRTANGRSINIDAIIAQNEDSIAIGNMKVNARGDELGPGGKIERSKDKVMADYYKLNTPVASDLIPTPREPAKKDLVDDWVEPIITVTDSVEEQLDEIEVKPPRGSLASSVSKTQLPKIPEPKKTGPTRI
jgi:hypothetical protein